MTREQAAEFVRELVQAINAHDARRMLSFYDDAAVAHTPAFPTIAGRAAIGENFETLFSLFPDWAVELKDLLVDGDRIAFTGIVRATDRNGWFGQPPTGERIEYRAIIVLEIANGKITPTSASMTLPAYCNGWRNPVLTGSCAWQPRFSVRCCREARFRLHSARR